MNYRPPSHSRPSAFTLVELLTVITIIAILMGLLFPAIGIAKDQARKAEARTAVMGITAAVKAYYTEYGKYPLGAQANPGAPGDVMFGDAAAAAGGSTPTPNQILFNILRNVPDASGGSTNSYNPRAIVFFDGKTVSDPDNPKSGFASKDGTTTGTPAVAFKKGAYFDPWGHEYCIAIDGDYDNKISNLPYTDFQSTNAPMTGVCVFSLGKDGKLGSQNTGNTAYRSGNNTADDIVSWQ